MNKDTRVYVRYAEYPYEGQSIHFATLDEHEALTRFDYEYHDSRNEELAVYINGQHVETWYRVNGKWVSNYIYGTNKPTTEYGTLTINDNNRTLEP